MKVQMEAQLYLDLKGLWRVRPFDTSVRDKGMPVPERLRGLFTDEHNGKRVIVEKMDGNIVSVLLEGGADSEILNQNISGPSLVTQSPRSTGNQPVPATATDDCIASCAVLAYTCAKAALGMGKEYKNHAKSLPMMIRSNGLGATLAFLKSKERDKYPHFARLHQDIASYLMLTQPGLKDGEFSERLAVCESAEIMALTKETLVFLAWLRRYADGLIQE